MPEKWVLYYHDNSNDKPQLYKFKLSTKYSFTYGDKQIKASEIYFRGLPDDNINQIINGDMTPLNSNRPIIQITQTGEFSDDRQFYAINLNKFAEFKKAATYKSKYTNLLKIEAHLDQMISDYQSYKSTTDSQEEKEEYAKSWRSNLNLIISIKISQDDIAYKFYEYFQKLSRIISHRATLITILKNEDLKQSFIEDVIQKLKETHYLLYRDQSLRWLSFGNRKRVREKAMAVVKHLIDDKNFRNDILKACGEVFKKT